MRKTSVSLAVLGVAAAMSLAACGSSRRQRLLRQQVVSIGQLLELLQQR